MYQKLAFFVHNSRVKLKMPDGKEVNVQKDKLETIRKLPGHMWLGSKNKNRKTIAALCLASVAFPFVPPAGNAFASIVQNIDIDFGEIATPTDAVEETEVATTSDAEEIEEAVKPDGFYSNNRDALFYRKNGETVRHDWIYENDTWYYAGETGKLVTGWNKIEDIWYYFMPSGSMKTGWIYDGDTWYYSTENGMVTGFQTIDEKDFYFNEDGSLAVSCEVSDGRMADQDGYLYDPSVVYPSFTYTKSPSDKTGTISGLNIAGMPAEFYMLSIAGETSGGQIVMGDRGRAYGLCQLDYRYDLTGFIRWAYKKHPDLWQEFSAFTGYRDGNSALIGNLQLAEAFRSAMERSYEGAVTDQLDYMREQYWDSFKASLNAAGFNLDSRNIAVSAAMFSVNVNCGAQPNVFIKNLSTDMTDAEMICKIYEIRNTIFANQRVGSARKGTTTRYRYSEPEMALDLLYGYTTIDTVRSYGGGVEWHGNIFTGSVSTCGIQGRSTDWQQYLASHPKSDGSSDNEETATPSNSETDTEETEEETEAFESSDGPGAIVTNETSEPSIIETYEFGPGVPEETEAVEVVDTIPAEESTIPILEIAESITPD